MRPLDLETLRPCPPYTNSLTPDRQPAEFGFAYGYGPEAGEWQSRSSPERHRVSGRRIAEVLAARGYSLALNDLRPPSDTLAAVRRSGVDAIELVGDISDEAVVGGFADPVLSRWGAVDVLVNNAGISCISAAEDTTVAQFRRVLDVNLLAPFLMARAFGRPSWHALGRIVNIASIAGLAGVAKDRHNASKHGLIGLTRTLAAEWVCAAFAPTPSALAG